MSKGVLNVVLTGITVAAIIGGFVAVAAFVGSFLGPRLSRVAQAQIIRRRRAECCPPGIGCNDPYQSARKCLRVESRRIAKVNELVELERTWAQFCGTPRYKVKAKAKALAGYGAVRDGIVARSLRDVGDMIDNSRRAQLPAHLTAGVQGEVVDNGSQPKKSPNPTLPQSY